MSYFPSYIKDIYDVSVSVAAFSILFPFLAYYVFQLIVGYIADKLITKGFKLVNVRKGIVFYGNILTSIFMIIGVYMNNLYAAIIIFTFSVGFSSFSFAAISANMLDITPKYSSILMGISNTCATINIFKFILLS